MSSILPPGSGEMHPLLREARAQAEKNNPALAAKALRDYLVERPEDATALRMLSDIAVSQGQDEAALDLLTRSLKSQPGQLAAHASRASVLLRMDEPAAALEDIQVLLASDPQNPNFRVLKARAFEAVEDYEGSVEIWRQLTGDHPEVAAGWVRYGTALWLLGRRDECIAAYRRAIAIDPAHGEAWWALADLKTFRFEAEEIKAMQAQLASNSLPPASRVRLHFALGKANADRGSYQTSFLQYAQGNALHRSTLRHDPATMTAYVAECKKFFTPEFFASRAQFGVASAAPIFIIGMMRSGSTLVEQILASHSMIEGTRELSDLDAVSRQIQGDAESRKLTYWKGLEGLEEADASRLGAEYLAAVAPHRKTDRPFFLDKMGANFVYIGLIQLLLPHAKIIDVRRHPMASGLSIFAQLFPRGQNGSYKLEDIGRNYRDYVELSAHFDAVLPGKVHRVFYEDLVADPETRIRALLDYLGVPFEARCLQFHETKRVVATVSADQVRRPIYKDALEQWRHFEPWLGPLAKSLGPVLGAYPKVPEEWR